ncbi:MAG: TonB-dependent receptor [Pseudomonadota bacterium]
MISPNRVVRTTAVVICSLVLSHTTLSPLALAQDAAAESDSVSINLAAGPLNRTLREIAKAFGASVFVADSVIDGLEAGAVSGSYRVETALAAALAGTGLVASSSAGGGFLIEKSSTRVPLTNTSPASVATEAIVEEVIVYGTKKNKSLQDTQVSVALVTQKDIAEQVLFNVEDILLRTPNVATAGGNNLNTLSIRGVSAGGVGGAGSGATVNVYVDGSPNSGTANLGSSNLWDVAQVEVLRGTQSTNQGRNALAGAVVISSADPTYESSVDLRILRGNENLGQYSGTVNLPILDDTLALRLVVDYREVDFGVRNVDTGNNTRFDEVLTARAKILWEPMDDLRIELGHQYVDSSNGQFNQVNPPGQFGTPEYDAFDPFGDETFGTQARFEDVTVNRSILDLTYDLNANWKLFGLLTYEDVERATDFGSVGTSLNPGDTLQLDIRAAFDYGRLSGWVGAYYFDEELLNTFDARVLLAGFGLVIDPPDSVIAAKTASLTKTENRAVYADLTYELSERWSINIGARYDEEEFSQSDQEGEFSVDPPDCIIVSLGGLSCLVFADGATTEPIIGDFNAFLPRASIIHYFDELRSLSFNISRGYRAGGTFGELTPAGFVQQSFDPEYLMSYELAFRSQWMDRTLTFNANVFFSDWEDQQVTIPGPTSSPFDVITTNAGSSELYGLEIELRKVFRERLQAFASLGITRTEFSDFPFAVDGEGNPLNSQDPQFANLSGNEFNTAPQTTIALGFSYDDPSGFFVSGNASYQSERFSDVTNLPENEADEYTLVNVRAGYRADSWSISAFANNIFDERIVLNQAATAVANNTGVVAPVDPPFFVVNDPRMFGVELRYFR